MKRLNLPLLISLVIGIALHVGLGLLPVSFLGRPPAEETVTSREPIEVAPLDKSDKQTVHSERIPEPEKESKVEPRFAGKFRNRTEKETKSPLSGAYRPGQIRPEVAVPDEQNGTRELGLKDLMRFGATPDTLPDDIARGNQTVLNTDAVIYAGFFERIADQIYASWVRNLEEAAAALELRGKRPREESYVTQLIVTLDKNGEVTAIETSQGSGIPEFDEASKRAFFRNGPFRNPPTQLFSKDGFIHLPYRFTINNSGQESSMFISRWGV